MSKRTLKEILDLIDEARLFWTFTNNPGPGSYPFGNRHQLRIIEQEIKKGEISCRYVLELAAEPGYPLRMSYSWRSFSEGLSQPSKVPRYNALEEEIDMTKMSIHDEGLREKVRLKCKNDWDLELTEEQVSMCIIEMEQQKLSIFHNQIWPNRRRWKKKEEDGRGYVSWKQMERITWDKTIDGYRAVAHRTGKFAGMDGVEFSADENGGLIARITVYALDNKGERHPYVGEARFNEFVQLVDEWEDGSRTGKRVPNNQWAEKPHNQLSVAAERQALRKAFQETDDDQEDRVAVQAPEPDLEQSRGSQTPLPPEEAPAEAKPLSARSQTVKSKKSSSASSAKETLTDGTYVGIPKSGFKAFQMYNKDERIVMYGQKGGVHHLALDSGKKVQVNADGYETKRLKREDEFKGGRKWKSGELYYDGSKIEKVADSKKDEWSLWLALDNGFKVLLDRWGKQSKKKERKKGKKSEDKAKSQSSTTSNPTSASTGSPPISEADMAGGNDAVDPEAVKTVEMMRKITIPLLKKWCDEIHNKRVNPKQAYQEFTGVILKKGQSMSLDDYKVLYQCLEEALEEKDAANG